MDKIIRPKSDLCHHLFVFFSSRIISRSEQKHPPDAQAGFSRFADHKKGLIKVSAMQYHLSSARQDKKTMLA